MRLFHYQSPVGNFGDDLNTWLWRELMPDAWDPSDGVLFSGIGTIIGNPMPAADEVILFTSGIGYRPPPPDWGSPRWKVIAVRGPLTAHVLGLPASSAVVDGAALLHALPRFRALPAAERRGAVFVPHFETIDRGDWAGACARAGVTLIDPRGESEGVIRAIRRAGLVIADSMHAAIVADALRVPWVPVASSNRINAFKWLDWALSLDLPWRPVRLPAISARARYLDVVQPLFGESFLSAGDADAAVRHYRRAVAGTRPFRLKIKHHLLRAPGRLPLPAIRRQLVEQQDRRAVEAVARTLAGLAQRPGFLSADARFAERLDALQDKLFRLQREPRARRERTGSPRAPCEV